MNLIDIVAVVLNIARSVVSLKKKKKKKKKFIVYEKLLNTIDKIYLVLLYVNQRQL